MDSTTAESHFTAERVLAALRDSVGRLRGLVDGLDETGLEGPSYASDWTVADVLSHLGSGAVIMQRRLDDARRGADTPDDFPPTVWDEWNAKPPREKAADSLQADQRLLDAFDAVGDEERARLAFAMGPLTIGFVELVAMRLNEHAFHTWDVEVMGDPAAGIPAALAALVVDNLSLIARFTARPVDGPERRLRIATTDPVRHVSIHLTPQAVTMEAWDGASEPDLELAAEAFCRLVYGRLDPAHTPDGVRGDEDDLGLLRRVFPGP
jgi:uncharacterized protein (TIGR03083 family)